MEGVGDAASGDARALAQLPDWFAYGRAMLGARARALGVGPADDVDPTGDGVPPPFHDALGDDEPFGVIVGNTGLSADEAEVLAVLLAADIDPYCAHLVADIQGRPVGARPTLGLLSGVFGDGHPGPLAVSHDSALRRAALVDVQADGPWVHHPIVVHPGLTWAIAGDSARDPELPVGLEVVAVDRGDDRDDVAAVSDLVVVQGPDRMRRRQAGCRHAPVGHVLCAAAPAEPAAWAALVREATISGAGVLVELDGSLPPDGRRWVERARHLSWILSARAAPPLDDLPDRPWLEVTADAADPTDAEWAQAFGADVERSHPLSFEQLPRVARARAATDGDLDAAVRRLASGPLEQLTRRIRPSRTWDDIVLGEERLDLLRAIADRYRHADQVFDTWGFTATPSRGLVCLFSGPSGTGKTLAAEIIAGELGLDLFKLDLSSVVSKYIGETEKNLEQIFDAASAGNMVLFFDEADALFGKRSEVRDARDRYANIEVSYLLQRLEAYDGVVIMATNFEKNIDEAFMRRIHVRVSFELPGPDERARIWRHNLPPSAPTDGVDVDWLAERFELSGGSIRNAAVQAAFAAAAAGTDITMGSAVTGVAREYRKLGRLVKKEQFGDYLDDVGERP